MGNFFASHQVDEDAASGIGPCGKGIFLSRSNKYNLQISAPSSCFLAVLLVLLNDISRRGPQGFLTDSEGTPC